MIVPVPHLRNPQERKVVNPQVVSCTETEKLIKPSVHIKELQDRLLLDEVVHPLDLPSKSSISKCMRDDLFMTKEKIQQIPAESRKDDNIQLRDEFLDVISDLDSSTIHCFD